MNFLENFRQDERMPYLVFPLIRSRRVSCSILVTLFLGWFSGCAAPQQTFAPEDASTERRTPTGITADASEDRLKMKSASNPVKPSVWSQWMGAFSKSPTPVPSKPTQPIPLPRTDTDAEIDQERQLGPDIDSDF